MSQSRFSIVLVGVSALLRRPLVSRLRPAAFTARGSGGFRRSALPSVSEIAARRVGLRAHDFRFSACAASGLPSASWPSGSRLPLSACTASGLPLGGLVLLPSASEMAARRVGLRAHDFRFRHAPLRSCPRRVGLRAHGFRFSARTASELPSAGWPSGSRLPLFGTHRFGVAAGRIGLRASASEWPRRAGSSAGRVGLRAHCFRFSACTASEWPLGEFVLPPSVSELPFGGLAFGLTASAFRHAPLRGCRWAGWFLRLPFRSCRSASWPSGSRLSLFGTHRSAPPHRRSEGRRSTPTRHLFHFKTLIPTC